MSQTEISMCRKYIPQCIPQSPAGIIKEREILHWNSSDSENEPLRTARGGAAPPPREAQLYAANAWPAPSFGEG